MWLGKSVGRCRKGQSANTPSVGYVGKKLDLFGDMLKIGLQWLFFPKSSPNLLKTFDLSIGVAGEITRSWTSKSFKADKELKTFACKDKNIAALKKLIFKKGHSINFMSLLSPYPSLLVKICFWLRHWTSL